MDLPENIRMDITTDNLPPNSISYASTCMTSRSSGPMKSLNFPPYSKSSKEWEYATGCGNLTTVFPRKGKVELSSPPPQGFILRFLLTLPPSGCRF
ncbi:hypothetical protein AVEN_197701-1 [Araneus ventricosus]|uniref:Uncharacterized protein n=1 Tax=Araneus ventricosus TaxID=182803 RepID=A0A4Y2CMI6_ARAVE|nr:hypothetical protein AVEN_197701-1 [Araneus ventricosus]